MSKRDIKREWKEKDRELRKKEEPNWKQYVDKGKRLDANMIDQLLMLDLNLSDR